MAKAVPTGTEAKRETTGIGRDLRRGPWPGLTLVLVLAVAAQWASRYVSVFPPVVLAMVGGIALRNSVSLPAVVQPGIKFTLKYLLRTAIVLLGSTLSLAAIIKNGTHTVVLILLLFVTALILGSVFARLFRLNSVIGLLIGAGTAICGATAILALSPLVRARDEETAYAIATIFTFNIVALLSYPLIGHALQMSQTAFGSWAGTAVNDTSVVIATGYVYGHTAGTVATVVKLTRTLLLVPLAVGVGLRYASTTSLDSDAPTINAAQRALKVMPWFVFGFVGLALLNSVGGIPKPASAPLANTATFLIIMVLGGVGLSVNLRTMARLGVRPIAVGLLLATVMGVISLGLIHILGIA